MKTSTASNSMAKVSLKDSVTIFKNIKNKPSRKAKALLIDMINQKRDINGKYYTGASTEILSILEEAENNGEALGLDRDKLFVKEATANQAFKYMLPKSRWSHRGKKAKICQLKIILEQR